MNFPQNINFYGQNILMIFYHNKIYIYITIFIDFIIREYDVTLNS